MSNFAHVGDIGVVFSFTLTEKDGVTPFDLTGNTTLEAKVLTRDGTEKTWTLTPSGTPTDGTATFTTTLVTDLDSDGQWTLQAHVAKPGVDVHFVRSTFNVYAVLAVA